MSQGETKLDPTAGRSLDHIGFEVKNLPEFLKRMEAEGVNITQGLTASNFVSTMRVAFIADPWGTKMEITEGIAPIRSHEASPLRMCCSGFDRLSGTLANQSRGADCRKRRGGSRQKAESTSSDVEYLLHRLPQQPREGRRPRVGRPGPPGRSG